jgi:hypothetical protein
MQTSRAEGPLGVAVRGNLGLEEFNRNWEFPHHPS